MSEKTYYINVLLAYSLSKEFTYKVNSDHKPSVGTVVSVPFRSKQYAGIVMGISDVPKISDKKIREISEISAFTKLNSRMIKFMNWVADYNLIDRGYILVVCTSGMFHTVFPLLGFYLYLFFSLIPGFR